MKWWFCCVLILLYTDITGQLSDFEHIDFKKADSIALLWQGEDLEELPKLAYALTESLSTDAEKFRSIYRWICFSIEGDYAYQTNISRKRRKHKKYNDGLNAWNNALLPKVFEKLLEEKRTVCTGYAYLLCKLANLAGLECQIIDGYGRSVMSNVGASSYPNHSWNAVRLDDKWYLCDPTWSSGRYKIQRNAHTFIFEYVDGYFLTSPALFAKNHFPLDTSWMLVDEKPTLDEFLHGPIVYNESFEREILPIEPKQMYVEVEKGTSFEFCVSYPDIWQTEDIHLDIYDGFNTRSDNYTVTTKDDHYQIRSSPFQYSGVFDVHLKAGKKYILTYVVRVGQRAEG